VETPSLNQALSEDTSSTLPAREPSEFKLLSYKVLIHVDKVVMAPELAQQQLPQEGSHCELSDSRGSGVGGGGPRRTVTRPPWRLGVLDRRGGEGYRTRSVGPRSYCQVVASSPPSWRLPHMDGQMRPPELVHGIRSHARTRTNREAFLPGVVPDSDTLQGDSCKAADATVAHTTGPLEEPPLGSALAGPLREEQIAVGGLSVSEDLVVSVDSASTEESTPGPHGMGFKQCWVPVSSADSAECERERVEEASRVFCAGNLEGAFFEVSISTVVRDGPNAEAGPTQEASMETNPELADDGPSGELSPSQTLCGLAEVP
jgi:hypothetical protein